MQDPIQGTGHYRPWTVLSAKDPFLEMLAARICFVICRKEGDKVSVSLLHSVSEICCQCNASTRADEQRQEEGLERQEGDTQAQPDSTWGYLQAVWLLKAYSWESVPPCT